MKRVQIIKTMDKAKRVAAGPNECHWGDTNARERVLHLLENGEVCIVDDGGGSTLTQEMLDEDILLLVE